MQTKLFIRLCLFGSFSLFLLLFVSVVTSMAATRDGDGDPKFYQKTKEGWFWYHDSVLAPKPEKKKKLPFKSRKLPSLQDYTIQQLWDMYPDDFQELLNVLQKKAVQRPTEQNITEYLAMQDVARRKALAYASATMYVQQKRSDIFGVNQVYPTTAPGVAARTKMQRGEIQNTISFAQDKYALIFFVQQGCGFCEKQTGILRFFKDKYGWPIKVVDIRKRPVAAQRFNVKVTPTLLLVKKGSESYMTVSTGVIALTALERKLYRAIRYIDGNTREDSFLLYDFEKGSTLDPSSILKKGTQPWKQIKVNK